MNIPELYIYLLSEKELIQRNLKYKTTLTKFWKSQKSNWRSKVRNLFNFFNEEQQKVLNEEYKTWR